MWGRKSDRDLLAERPRKVARLLDAEPEPERPRRSRRATLAYLLLLGLGVYAIVAALPDPESKKVADWRTVDGQQVLAVPSVTPQSPAERRRAALFNTDVANVSWWKAGGGTVMMVSLTIKNSNDFAVKDIEITCEHYANSGTRIDSNTRTIYERIPPKGNKAIKEFSMGFIHSQAARTGCRVTNLALD